MRLRWYKGFSYRGNPKQLVQEISKQIQEQNLSKFVPLLRLEKGVTSSRKPFYFFIGIESSTKGEIPPEIMTSNLLMSRFFRKEAVTSGNNFTYEQIKPMVGVAHDVHDYTNPIPYQPLEKDIYDNPFDELTSTSYMNQLSSNVEAISSRYEQLLYWLSAIGNGTWESFKKSCEALKLEEPKRILRRLKLLGHIESSQDGSRWSVAPIAIVKIKSQSTSSQEFILCGQRSVNLLTELKKQTKIEFSNQARGEAPPRVLFKLDDSKLISNLVEQLKLKYSINYVEEVSNQLTIILPDFATWKQSLTTLHGIVSSIYEWKRFDNNNFLDCIFCGETGLYQMWVAGESLRPHRTLFYDAESNSWRQGDWYGLRFLALQHSGFECVARYDRAKWRLAIPISQRWPEIYERALVLASGHLPTYQNSWLLYENVPMQVMSLLTDKLNIKCEEVSASA